MIKYYIVDVETNGLRSGYHTINEISVIRCDDRVQLTEFIKCETPERSSWDALKITNKTLADLSKGKSDKEVVAKINKFLEEDGADKNARCWIGHNCSFDRRFIHTLWESCGQELPVNLWIDTQALVTEFIKQSDQSTLNITKTASGKISKTLQASCDLVGIKHLKEAHASRADTRNTYLLWKRLTEEKGIDHLPFHKTFAHTIKKDSEYADIDDLDMSDVL